MKRNIYRLLVALLLPMLLLISCEVNNVIKEPTLKDAIERFATEIKDENLANTAQVVATSLPGEELLATASSLIKPEEQRLLATIQSFSAREGIEIKSTIEAYISRDGLKIENTLQSFANDKQIPATLEAYLNDLKEPFIGEIPEDIPLVDSRRINKLFKTPQLITYSTSFSYDEVISFYKIEMPKYGWIKIDRGTTELEQVTILQFSKKEKDATISIYKNILGESTIVLISIRKK